MPLARIDRRLCGPLEGRQARRPALYTACSAAILCLTALPGVAAAETPAPVSATAPGEAIVTSWLAPVEAARAAVDTRPAPMRPAPGARLSTYVARAGDTLRSIAYRFYTSPILVAVANKLPFDPNVDNKVEPGRQLTVPVQIKLPRRLAEGEQLLSEPGVHSERNDSNWGRPHVVHLLRTSLREMHKRWPTRHPAVLGSLSRPNGGKLGRHKSHRSGQDVDIGYFTYESNRDFWGGPRLDEIDYQRLWFFVDHIEKTGAVAAIYMAPGIQKRLHAYALSRGESATRLRQLFQFPGGRAGTMIRNEPGHRDHFHVRFLCPEDLPTLLAGDNT